MEQIGELIQDLNIIELEQLRKWCDVAINEHDKKELLDKLRGVSKITKNITNADTSYKRLDYMINFSCEFTTPELHCTCEYYGDDESFEPSIKINNCCIIPSNDKHVYMDLVDGEIDNIDEYITDMEEYKRLCKLFKMKRITLAKKIASVMNAMEVQYLS